MIDEASPRPWRVMRYTAEDEPDRIIDANGDEVAIELLEADAQLIVKAVNLHECLIEHNKLNAEKVCELFEERDRLRDIVKRIEEEVGRCHKRDGQISQELIDAIYEARAIGEDLK